MTISTPQEFLGLPCVNTRLMAIDVGFKTLGLAVSDETWLIACGLKTLDRRKLVQDAAHLQTIIKQSHVVGLVIGLPVHMNGDEGRRVQSTRDFIRDLAKHIEIPITFWDERLTTAMAERILLQANISRKKRKLSVDKIAASLILQNFLDWIRYERRKLNIDLV